jgi:hypothetical protein
MDRNSGDLVDGSMGGWTPLRENMSKDVFGDMMIRLVIPLRMPSEDSFQVNGSGRDPHLAHSGK